MALDGTTAVVVTEAIQAVVLIIGKYRILDKLMKFIIVLLTLSTVVALFSALGIEKEISPIFQRIFIKRNQA